MKKTYLVTTIILLMFVISGCMSTETEPYGDGEEESTISFEEKLEAIDWNQQYITAELSDTFTIDAHIIPSDVYDKEIGLYKYNKFTEEDYDREALIQSLETYNEKYTRDLEPEVYMSVDTLDLYVNFGEPEFLETIMGTMDTLDAYFPIDNQEGQYDKEKIESVINEFTQTVSGSIDLSGYGYRCLCWNQELREKLRAEEENWSYTVLDSEALEEDFYHIRIESEPLEGCFMQHLMNVSRPLLSEEQQGDLTEIDVNGRMEPEFFANDVDIYLDKDYNILAYNIWVHSKIDENPFDTTGIVSGKDIVKAVYDKFSYSYKKITVKDVRLVYSRYLDESLKEDNTREPYVAPYWIVTFFMEGDARNPQGNYQIYYSAIDGALIYSVV